MDNLVSAGYNVGVGRADITGPAAEVRINWGSVYLLTFDDFVDLFFPGRLEWWATRSRARTQEVAQNHRNTDRSHFSLCKGWELLIRNPHTQLCPCVHRWGCRDWDEGGLCLLWHGHDGAARQGETSFTLDQDVTDFQLGVLAELEAVYPGMYTEKNLVLSATHTHSGPAGFMQYVLFNIPNLGYVKQTHEGLVEGITRSIAIAHDALAPGRWDSRSNWNFENNPKGGLGRGWGGRAGEHQPKPHKLWSQPWGGEGSVSRRVVEVDSNFCRYASNLDTNMVQLNFYNAVDEPIGILNWWDGFCPNWIKIELCQPRFSVHPNSMNNTNHYISGDNKGAASLMMEKVFQIVSALWSKY